MRGTRTWLCGAALLTGVAMFACGGGGSDAPSGPGERVTDPALVPTSTPIQNPVVYRISNDVIQIEGGTAATVPPGATTPAAGRQTYVVEPGDTCSGIAASLGITTEELRAANRSIDADCGNLDVGDELVVPGGSATNGNGGGSASTPTATPTPGSSGGGTTYTVGSGDTCADIAAQHGISSADLIAANPSINSSCSNLDIGDVLKIP